MSFDIYGEHLRPGFCEVHPYVACSYPCPLCSEDYYRLKREKDEENRYWNEQADLYYAQLAGNEEYDSWFPTNSPAAS